MAAKKQLYSGLFDCLLTAPGRVWYSGGGCHMNRLSERLRKLEAVAAQKATHEDVASWPTRADAVKRYAIGRLSPADQAYLRELDSPSGNQALDEEFVNQNSPFWTRLTEAFDWAVQEVPAPYVMCVSDLFGQW